MFERVLKDFGLPKAIRTDNGVPFSRPTALFGIYKLSVCLRLGIQIERIKPAHPEQNGRHERMHLTLKKEATKPAAKNLIQQQGKFDHFLEQFNQERPHQAIGMKYPAELNVTSSIPYKGLGDLVYPFHDRTITVTCCGRICIGKRKINLSTVFAGQNVGRTVHSELGQTPMQRFLTGPSVARDYPGSDALRDAFRIEVKRKQRRSDGSLQYSRLRRAGSAST